jgi:hypothetical protein
MGVVLPRRINVDADRPNFLGDARTLDGAMQSACHAIGLSFAEWMPIGPPIGISD